MRTVTVKLRDVDEDLYQVVIVPNQQVRRLAGLISDLLAGYRDDPYIRQYVDGARLESDPGVQASLLKDIADQQEELKKLQYLTEVTRSSLQEGIFTIENPVETVRSIPQALPVSSSIDERMSSLESVVAQLVNSLTPIVNTPQTIINTPSPIVNTPPVIVTEPLPAPTVVEPSPSIVLDFEDSPPELEPSPVSFSPPLSLDEPEVDTSAFDNLFGSL